MFSGNAEADEATREGEIDQIHAKIGQLVVEGDFSVGPPGAERGGETRHDRTGSPTTAGHAPMRPGRHQPVGILGRPADRKPRDRCRPPGDRRPVPRDALVRLAVARKRVRRLMARMGLARHLYRQPKSAVRHPQHRVFSYRLRNMAIDRPDQAWCADITDIPMRRGCLT